MAYVTATGVAFTDKASLVALINTNLLAMGWSLYDDQSGSSYRIYRNGSSALAGGEAGNKPCIYLQVNYSTTNVVFTISMFWNATTHTYTPTGAPGAAPSTSMCTMAPGTLNLWMYGNKDWVLIMTENAGTLVSAKVFLTYVLNKPSNAIYTSTTGAVSAGTSVSIPVTSSSGFVVGARYLIYDPTTSFRQNFVCTAIADSTHITADALTTVGYASGSQVGTHTTDVVFGASTLPTSYSVNHHKCTIYNVAHSTPGGGYSVATAIDPTYLSMALPYFGTLTKRILYPQIVYETSGNPVSYRYVGDLEDANGYIYSMPPLSSITVANDAFVAANFDAVYFGQLDSGTSTSVGGSTTLNDSGGAGRGWTTNSWVDKVVVCTSGTEVGQIRKITANTTTQLTVTPAWTTIPNTGTFVICDRGYRYVLDTNGFLLREGV